jgi:hypothetical protein
VQPVEDRDPGVVAIDRLPIDDHRSDRNRRHSLADQRIPCGPLRFRAAAGYKRL